MKVLQLMILCSLVISSKCQNLPGVPHIQLWQHQIDNVLENERRLKEYISNKEVRLSAWYL